MGVVQVELGYHHSSSFFQYDNLSLKKGLTVIVDTDKGLQFGKILQVFEDEDFHFECMGRVLRISSKKDYLHHLDNLKKAEESLKICRDLVSEFKLNMTLLDSCYNFDRSQLLFRFVADERVDFRNLARELGTTFKTRIELRQIGIRDKSKEVGGIGPCGRLICCSSFLRNFDSVTINMAKNQNVSLNPTKINGVCGRLLCCLKYENDVYSDMRNDLPKIGSLVTTKSGRGKVVSVDVLKRIYTVELDNMNRLDISLDDCKK